MYNTRTRTHAHTQARNAGLLLLSLRPSAVAAEECAGPERSLPPLSLRKRSRWSRSLRVWSEWSAGSGCRFDFACGLLPAIPGFPGEVCRFVNLWIV